MCSHACTATVTALRDGGTVGTARRALAAAARRSIRVRLTRRARGAAALTYRLTVTSGERRGTGMPATTEAGTRGRVADVFLTDAVRSQTR
jgi:hypothetical protein